MFFRIGSKTGAYYDFEASMPADLPAKTPADISMVYWDYYHKDRKEYLAMIDGHSGLQREVIFAGGIWNWCGIGPDYAQTFRTTFPALSACREKNIRNIFATMWGDDEKALLALADELALLASEYEDYHSKTYTYWHTLNKAFGYDKFELRIGGAILRIRTAERKLRDYVNGELEQIEELEEKLLWYNDESTKDQLTATQRYSWISSVSHEW